MQAHYGLAQGDVRGATPTEPKPFWLRKKKTSFEVDDAWGYPHDETENPPIEHRSFSMRKREEKHWIVRC